MEIKLNSKFNIGDTVGWYAPYGYETVTIERVTFDETERRFKYKTKEYTFWFDERELG